MIEMPQKSMWHKLYCRMMGYLALYGFDLVEAPWYEALHLFILYL